jgi:membrane associated rhomboid family serine protease
VLPLKDNVPTRHFPVVTASLIVANVLFFVFVQEAGTEPGFESSVRDLAYHPCEVNDSCAQGQVGEGWLLTAFTSMFMHGDWLHLIGNMLFLWIFGNNVEDSMGRFRYLVFYVLAGLAATALQTVITLETASAQAATIPNLGASGAVSGVLGAYFLLLPTARVLTLIFFFLLREVPAFFFLLVWFAFQAYDANLQLEHPPEGGGVAVFAHLGGMVFGLLTVKLFQVRDPMRPAY